MARPTRPVAETFAALVTLVAAAATPACGGAPAAKNPAQGSAAPAATTACTSLAPGLLRFAETLEDVTDAGKVHGGSYAGVMEMLLTFERASSELEAQMSATKPDDASMKEILARGGAALQQANDFARGERDRAEKASLALTPLAKDAEASSTELAAACAGKRPPRECAAVGTQTAKMDAGSFRERLEAVEELSALKIVTPAVARARDRVVASNRALAKAIEAQGVEMKTLGKRWAAVQGSVVTAFDDLGKRCKDAADPPASFLADAKPDPRKLTVLVRVKPPAGIDDTFEELAERASDADEKAFYQARARGAFGSGFVVVRQTPAGGSETLVITNRHVVELADRAALELADGTALGPAEIVYTDPLHDVAVLRPTKKLPFDRGFAFSVAAAKDQQGVIATGFPGMAGRPSYQTTRGYVSNESFKLDEASRQLTYVQHTAPIDPGSSGGPLTDERGMVLGVNTLKVTNREGVALAVPTPSILEAIRRADATESRKASAPFKRDTARLACLALVAELASKKPRLSVLENMISNHMVSAEGLQAAMGIDDDTFAQIWQSDSVRAMRIATLFRVQSVVSAAGGASPLETCSDVNADDVLDVLSADEMRYRVRLANWDTREVAFRWEQGHWKLGRMDLRPVKPIKAAPAAKPGAAKPAPATPKKKR